MIHEALTTLTLPYPGGRTKTVRVFVPAHEEGETFPAVYMTDGQNLFEDDNVQFGSWFTREAVRAERESSGKAAIIVGIHNDGHPAERANDLTPQSIGEMMFPPDMPEEIRKMIHPQGEVFDDFVVNTVMPAIEAQFPVQTGREHTAFCGSSSGGLQTFFTVLSHPDVFSAAGALSPCLMLFHPEAMNRWIREKAKAKELPFLFLYSGGADPLEQAICQSTEGVCAMLADCYPATLVQKDIRPEQPHNESSWAPVFREFLHAFLSRS